MKPKLKTPGTKRLILEYDGLLANFGFKFNLRRYNWGIALGDRARACTNTTRARALWLAAGAYTRPLFSST
jgi:hypothetical protein